MIMSTAADKSYLAKAHPSIDKLDRTGRLGNSSKSTYSYNINILLKILNQKRCNNSRTTAIVYCKYVLKIINAT
jgi:hypothetical protein